MVEQPTTSPGVEDVRSSINHALGDKRLAGIEPNLSLLRSGLITSIELVTVVVSLESRYGVTIPASKLTPEQLTLEHLARLIQGAAAPDIDRQGHPSPDSSRAPTAKAFALVFLAGVFLILLDTTLNRLVEGPWAEDYAQFMEHGQRLYPYSGIFSQDDFQFAVEQHCIKQEGGSRPAIVFLGDSGTFGSYLPAEASLPAATEQALGELGEPLPVYNMAWYGQLLVKDLMLLDAVWAEPMKVVVFTVGDAYFARDQVRRWIHSYRHISMNVGMFETFVSRVPDAERPPFLAVLRDLKKADAEHHGGLRRWEYRRLALMHYRPFVQEALRVEALPALFGSRMRWERNEVRNQRAFLESRPPEPLGLRSTDVDPLQIQILETTVRLLQSRGAIVVLFVEPRGPQGDYGSVAPDRVTAFDIAAGISQRTGSPLVDASWSLGAEDFLDSTAHYTEAANRRLGWEVASAIRSALAGNGNEQ